jgi:hypothetical protein
MAIELPKKNPIIGTSRPPAAFNLSTDLLENPNKEPLQILFKPYLGLKEIPSELAHGNETTLVFIGLQECHKKAGFVAEGLLGNIIWGFEQCGYDPRAVARGLTRLRDLGYIRYTDPLGNTIHEATFDPKNGGIPIWLRYTDKMVKLFVREGNHA